MVSQETDIVIIGAGPVGLFTIFECGMLGMSCHVVDALESIGGQCKALYPEKPIYDIPAHPHILGGNLIDQLETQAEPFNPTYHLGQQVTSVTKTDTGWQVGTSKGTLIDTKAIIIAAGVGAFGPNKPPLDNIEEFEGTSVFYMVAKRNDFAGKRIAIAGGGDSAADWAISLSDIAEKIYFIHRRPKFRAAPDSITKLEKLADEGKIEMVIPYQLHKLHGDNGQLSQLELTDLDGHTKMLDVDCLLPFFGMAQKLGPIAEWGLNIDMHHITVDPATQQTNQVGIYAVGDICTYKNKLKLILNGFAEAAMAAHHARGLVFPDQEYHFVYSTSQGVPE